jgi:hypothetical protein
MAMTNIPGGGLRGPSAATTAAQRLTSAMTNLPGVGATSTAAQRLTSAKELGSIIERFGRLEAQALILPHQPGSPELFADRKGKSARFSINAEVVWAVAAGVRIIPHTPEIEI